MKLIRTPGHLAPQPQDLRSLNAALDRAICKLLSGQSEERKTELAGLGDPELVGRELRWRMKFVKDHEAICVGIDGEFKVGYNELYIRSLSGDRLSVVLEFVVARALHLLRADRLTRRADCQ